MNDNVDIEELARPLREACQAVEEALDGLPDNYTLFEEVASSQLVLLNGSFNKLRTVSTGKALEDHVLAELDLHSRCDKA